MPRPEIDAQALQRLMDEAACRALVLQSAALADRGEAEALAALFTDNAPLTRPNGAVLEGRAAIAQAYRQRPAQRLTVHLLGGTLFDEIGPDHARATTPVLLWAGDQRDAPGPQGRPAEARQIVGHFRDDFVRTEAGWRIARRAASFALHTP